MDKPLELPAGVLPILKRRGAASGLPCEYCYLGTGTHRHVHAAQVYWLCDVCETSLRKLYNAITGAEGKLT